MTDKKTLLLVDGSSYLYRAFHAMPDLRAVPGDPTSPATGAIRGMINMMQALRSEVRADYAACVFDAPGKTFRDDWYPEYKANRSPMPDDLRSQIEPIHEVVRLLGWPVLCVPGVEADDVIGTLACMAREQGIEVIVSSGDKDLSQLVDEHITIIDTMNGKKRDVAGVTAEFGVPPRLMVDYQTLVGDTVDNVPGVDKVGPKTAAKWLLEYGSLDALIARAARGQGRGRREPAQGAGLAAQGPRAGDHPDRLRPRATTSRACRRWTTSPSAARRPRRSRPSTSVRLQGPGQDAGSARRAARADRGAPKQERRRGPATGGPVRRARPVEACRKATNLHYDTVLTWEQFDAWLAQLRGRASWWRSTPRPLRSTRCAPRSSACRFSVEAGRGGLHPAGPQLPRCARRSCRATRCWRG